MHVYIFFSLSPFFCQDQMHMISGSPWQNVIFFWHLSVGSPCCPFRVFTNWRISQIVLKQHWELTSACLKTSWQLCRAHKKHPINIWLTWFFFLNQLLNTENHLMVQKANHPPIKNDVHNFSDANTEVLKYYPRFLWFSRQRMSEQRGIHIYLL